MSLRLIELQLITKLKFIVSYAMREPDNKISPYLANTYFGRNIRVIAIKLGG